MTVWSKWFGQKKDKNDYLADYGQIDKNRLPRHVAIIMDGNGRWANKRGLPRTFGHRKGVEALRLIVSSASEIGIEALTVYAFSTENWKRPSEEVDFLMRLFSEYLEKEVAELHNNNVKIAFIGEVSMLAASLRQQIEAAQKLTADNAGLKLNIAVNYGGRAEIVRAIRIIAQKVEEHSLDPAQITEETIQNYLYTANIPDPDLIIRPSGDLRLSNFLLWQSAYAELWFTKVNWPDFKPEHLVQAIVEYQQRERRFGGINKSK